MTFPTCLIGKSYDIFILLVGKLENIDVPSFRQGGFDLPDIRFELFFSVTETQIIRELAHLEANIQQKLSEFRCVVALFSCLYR